MQFIALIGTVSLEIALVSRFWTRLFIWAWSISYVLTLPWLVIIPLVRRPPFGQADIMAATPQPSSNKIVETVSEAGMGCIFSFAEGWCLLRCLWNDEPCFLGGITCRLNIQYCTSSHRGAGVILAIPKIGQKAGPD
jgi:hypothetical protein